jgi:hypothetical protein
MLAHLHRPRSWGRAPACTHVRKYRVHISACDSSRQYPAGEAGAGISTTPHAGPLWTSSWHLQVCLLLHLGIVDTARATPLFTRGHSHFPDCAALAISRLPSQTLHACARRCARPARLAEERGRLHDVGKVGGVAPLVQQRVERSLAAAHCIWGGQGGEVGAGGHPAPVRLLPGRLRPARQGGHGTARHGQCGTASTSRMGWVCAGLSRCTAVRQGDDAQQCQRGSRSRTPAGLQQLHDT